MNSTSIDTTPMISVVTVTKQEGSLFRAAESVAAQDYSGEIEHVIVFDDIEPNVNDTDAIRQLGRHVRICRVHTSEEVDHFQPFYSVSRIGYLRNQGINNSRGRYIAYLDDDNTFLPDHLSSLSDVLHSYPSCDIAYSWRRLWHADGAPYLEQSYPWLPVCRLATDQKALDQHIYNDLVATGIRCADDNIQRDTVLTITGLPVFTIDTSELLVRRNVHDNIRFVERFTWREMLGDYSDDYAFLKKCHEAGVRFCPSQKATLNYYLGGVSNNGRNRR